MAETYCLDGLTEVEQAPLKARCGEKLITLLNKPVLKMVVVEFSIVPVGEGTSVSRILAHAVKELENMGVKYELTPMCTVFEARSVEEAFKAVEAAHEAVFKHGAKRVVTIVKIDDRRDVERSMKDKVESLKKAVGSI
jgi:uncharacterized protein (TIGR00106 family)